jgi:hypothetical protein
MASDIPLPTDDLEMEMRDEEQFDLSISLSGFSTRWYTLCILYGSVSVFRIQLYINNFTVAGR